MSRDFTLPEEETTFLNEHDWQWETITDGSTKWVLIHGFPIPSEYNEEMVSVAIQIQSGYPTSQLDMAYFYPWIKRKDNIPIRQADQPMNIQGKSYQRWSRHYTWCPGLHDLTTHIKSIKTWLEAEFRKNPSALASGRR
jgi:hypothetical protein